MTSTQDTDPFWKRLAESDPDSLRRLYQCNQASEILGRTRRIIDRAMPRRQVPHGFYDPEGFIHASRLGSHRRLLARSVQQRIAAKVKERDKLLTPEEIAERMKDPRLGTGLRPFIYRPDQALRASTPRS